MYILGGVWKAGVFWSAGQLFRNILPERKNRHHHHRGYIFVTFITSFSKTTKLFSSNLMNKAPNGNEAGDQTFAIFLKRQRDNFFFIRRNPVLGVKGHNRGMLTTHQIRSTDFVNSHTWVKNRSKKENYLNVLILHWRGMIKLLR